MTTAEAPARASSTAMARAAPPAEDYRAEAGGRADGRKGLEEALTVGIVAGQLAVPIHDAIHRADGLGGGVQSVEQRDHCELVRDRTVKPLPAHCPGPADGISQPFWPHLDGEVSPVQAHGGKRRLDHGLGRILGNREPEDAEQVLPVVLASIYVRVAIAGLQG
jgi:hypothetical protein